jgi:hypothetical protein
VAYPKLRNDSSQTKIRIVSGCAFLSAPVSMACE